MSRSVDPEIIASLHEESSQEVYEDTVKALTADRQDLFEVEFLGQSHPLPPHCNLLLDGKSIGISKMKLVQAFLIARQKFFRLARNCPEGQQSELRDATAVILLMDPEHLTAANTRKRLIQRCRTGSRKSLESVLKRELLFIDSLLTSRLHRHTKSPTLWGHRRWVLGVCRSLEMEPDVYEDLTTVVFIAAERHPRNYYAWSHMRWLLQTFGFSRTFSGDPTQKVAAFDNSKLLSAVLSWCLGHPGDTSGFSFLLFCLSTINPLEERSAASSYVCGELLRLAVSFKWTHESVWGCLRTLVASGQVSEDCSTAFLQAIKEIEVAAPYPPSRSILHAAQNWAAKYKRFQEV